MLRQRIVVVEDEPDILEVLRYNLERENYLVDSFSRGDEALEAVRSDPPDLLLLDLMLLGMDGLEITRILKRESGTAQIPLIMLTAKNEEEARADNYETSWDATDLGVNYFWNKRKVKVQFTYRMGQNVFGVKGDDADTGFLEWQFVF